jgi:haloacetate dehalogenase
VIQGIDHIAITVRDIEKTCEFYRSLFGPGDHFDYAPDGVLLVRQMKVGGALLSIHQQGNGIDLVARQPVPGSGDFCFRWSGPIESAVAVLQAKGVAVIEGPAPRRTADGLESRSVYFRDPDGNLVELMAAASAGFFAGFQTHRIEVEGVGLHVVTGGQGPPLLLVHGAPQSHIMWRRVAPELAKRFTVIIPDLRGYGRSDKPARGDYSKRRMAADLAAVMDALGHERFLVAGHDRGARVTRRLVKDHPQRIVRAAILDIVPTSHIYGQMNRQIAISMWNWCVWAAAEPIPETILDPVAVVRMIARSTDAEPAAEADYVLTNGNAEALHAMCEDYRAGASVDLEHDAADADRPIEVPLLVAWGKQSFSTGTLFDVQRAWAGEGSDITFRTIDCGHFLPEEAPAETSAMLLDFFAPAGQASGPLAF